MTIEGIHKRIPPSIQEKLKAVGKLATDRHPSHHMPRAVLDKIVAVLPFNRTTIKSYCKSGLEEEHIEEKKTEEGKCTILLHAL